MSKQPDKRKKVAVVAGVGKRKEDHDNMAITATDAMLIKKALVSTCLFPEENCCCLTNEQATKKQIISALKQLAATNKAEPPELTIVYLSGHALMIDGGFYLVCNDSLNNDLPRTAISRGELLELLDDINTEKLLVLLDCCHANGIHQPPIAMIFDKDEFLQKPNRIVLAASHAKEVAYLCKPVSLFTFALIEGLAGTYFKSGDKDVNVFDLAMYVRERVVPLSRSTQTPQLHVLENAHTKNFIVTRHPNGRLEKVFEEEFMLIDEVGKEISLGGEVLRDTEYRQQFNWLNTINNHFDNSITLNSPETNQAINIKGASVNVINYNTVVNEAGLDRERTKQPNDESENQLIVRGPDKRSIQDIVLMKNDQLVLVEGIRVKYRLDKMMKGEASNVLVLKGEPETGLSHLSNLFSEIADKFKYFEYRYINICDLSKVYPGEMIDPLLIAQVIANMMDFTFDRESFDVYGFLKMLRRELEKPAQEKCRFCLYFDQFSVKCSSDLSVFMQELVKLVVVENKKMFLVIGGYGEVNQWPKNIRDIANPIKIGSYFTRDVVNSFLKKLYNYLADVLKGKMNWETFLESANSNLPDSLFATPATPNVRAVGEAIQDWFASIRNNLQL